MEASPSFWKRQAPTSLEWESSGLKHAICRITYKGEKETSKRYPDTRSSTMDFPEGLLLIILWSKWLSWNTGAHFIAHGRAGRPEHTHSVIFIRLLRRPRDLHESALKSANCFTEQRDIINIIVVRIEGQCENPDGDNITR